MLVVVMMAVAVSAFAIDTVFIESMDGAAVLTVVIESGEASIYYDRDAAAQQSAQEIKFGGEIFSLRSLTGHWSESTFVFDKQSVELLYKMFFEEYCIHESSFGSRPVFFIVDEEIEEKIAL
jgi:hypothetical protein